MFKNDFGEVCIISKEDLIRYCRTNLKNFDDIIKGVDFCYLIERKSIYVIDIADEKLNKCRDYYFDGKEGLWFLYEKVQFNSKEKFLLAYKKACTLVSKCLNACDFQKDSLVIARAFVNQSMSNVSNFLDEKCFPTIMLNKDYIGKDFHPILDPIRFYQIVPDLFWLKYVINLGVKVVQLRIKGKPTRKIEHEIKEGIHIAKRNNVKLFINDYWEFAIKYKAYGVHLGQEDLKNANFNEIFNAGLRLGISTHCYYELAIAQYLRPSYIAFGPIFQTTLKNMNFMPQGIDLLHYWVKHLRSKIVAIGGVNLLNIDSIIETGVNGIAVVSAVINSENPDKVIHEFLQKCKSIC